MDALPFVIQIALFGAAGTSFVLAHLKNLRAADRSGAPPMERWRIFRHPHAGRADTPDALRLRRAAALQTAWGFCYLAGAFAAPAVFRLLHVGA